MAAAVVAVPVLVPQTASASPSAGKSTGRHCVLDVTGQKPSGEFITAPMRCYADYDALLASEGVTLSTDSGSRSAVESAQQAARLLDITIAIHYVDAGGLGTSLSIMGGTCTGGWLNMPTGFINNISSTWTNVCSVIHHYAGTGRTGTAFVTGMGLFNITGSMNDNTESAQYN